MEPEFTIREEFQLVLADWPDKRTSNIDRVQPAIGKTTSTQKKNSASAHAKRSRRKDAAPSSLIPKLLKNPKTAMALALLSIDSLFVSFIIAYVPCKWVCWRRKGLQELERRHWATCLLSWFPLCLFCYSVYYRWIGFSSSGDLSTRKIEFSCLLFILFGILYIINLGIVLLIYVKTDVLPWWALSLICLSKRVHSIFVLRLFNDCFAMTLLHAAMASILYQRWHLGLITFSAAVSIKMNVLLFAPPLFILMLKAMNISGVISALAGAALVQIVLGLPFLVSYPIEYISRAFNLGRVFIHFWSVNFKFIPETIFVLKELVLFADCSPCMKVSFLIFLCLRIRSCLSTSSSSWPKTLKKEYIVTTIFSGNFIGIVCARSLHYQFYSWYFYSLPYLLWRTPFLTLLRSGALLECLSIKLLFICSTPLSSLMYTVGFMVKILYSSTKCNPITPQILPLKFCT
ncbi:hypothetical protein CRYUN_Cryun23aG0098700 [Craigia yunnanensis]